MIKKILLLLASTIALFSLWLLGLEKIYAHILKFGASLLLAPFSNITPVLKADQAHPDFCVAVGQDGYCMELELFGLSIIVMLSWYILMLFLNPSKRMFFIAAKHLLIFYFLQVLTMTSLALYEYGAFFQQLNNALRQSFIIIALGFIIWDNYLHGIFKFSKKEA